MSYSVAERQKVERRITTAVVKELLDAGFAITVNDGEEIAIERSMDQTDILDAMFGSDEDTLYIYKPGDPIHYGWVYFVYGNDGPDVINDYTTGLEQHISPALELAELEEEKLA